MKNEKVEVYIDGKLHKTLPVEVFAEDVYTRNYVAYVIDEEKIKLSDGKEIEFIFKAEDNNGLKYSYVVEKGTWSQDDGYVAEEPVYTSGAYSDLSGRLTIE